MTLQRVQYREGQVLMAQDLTDEGDYRVALRRRHNAVMHGWGILNGLELRYELGRLLLEPGMAVDGHGRELVVTRPQVVPDQVTALMEEGGLFFWLRYAQEPAAPLRGRPGQPTRLREEARLCVGRASAMPPPPPAAEDCRPGRRDAPPAADPTAAWRDDAEWPVFIGRAYRENDKIKISPAGRPYATLVGETVRSVSTVPVPEDPENPPEKPLPPVPRATLTVDQTPTGRARFAVALPDARGQLTGRIVIESEGDAVVRGHTTLAACQTLAAANDEQAARLIFAEQSEEVQAWQIAAPEALAAKLDRFLGRSGARAMPAAAPTDLRPALATQLNALINEPGGVAEEAAPSGAPPATLETMLTNARQTGRLRLRPQTMALLRDRPQGREARLLNRRLLEDLFPCEVARDDAGGAYRLRFGPPPPPPKTPAALPWRVYRADVEREGRLVPQLRIELPAPGDDEDPAAIQLAVGYFDKDNNLFRPCLTVDAGCTVRVEKMTVTGRILRGPIQANLADPRLLDELIKNWLKGSALGAELELTLSDDLDFDPESLTTMYTVTVRNVGRSTVYGIRLVETHVVNGGLGVSMTLPPVSALEPGDYVPITVAYDGRPAEGTLYVAIQATGSTKSDFSVPVYAQVRGQFSVPPPPPTPDPSDPGPQNPG
jgi:hypothetical protein